MIVAGSGVMPARICTPGAVMSGLLTPSVWPGPPRELKAAMTSPWLPVAWPCVKVAVTPLCDCQERPAGPGRTAR